MLPALASCLLATALAATPQDTAPDAYRGQIVVLNYWASWCAPCKREMPLLEAIQREYGPRGIQLIGVSIDEPEDRKDAQAFARRVGVSYPQRFDGTTAEMVERKLGDAVPATVIFDRDGAPVFRLVGEIHAADLRQRLDWLLGGRSEARPDELALPAGISAEHFREHHEAGESE